METDRIIDALARTGELLSHHGTNGGSYEQGKPGRLRSLEGEFEEVIRTEHLYNAWFTEENIRMAISAIALNLQPGTLKRWLDHYPGLKRDEQDVKTVGVVMAGNIPLVGFHDLMSVLVSGHRFLGKPSSKDDRLIRKVAEIIAYFDEETGNRIAFTDNILKGPDAVIATGSDNSSRYFDYYFRDIPHIIRKNRNGVAIITGNETPQQLQQLAADVFSYFGLGCRNITKLFLPEGYDAHRIMEAFESHLGLTGHHKYANNLAYYRTVYMMNREEFLDNGVILLKRSSEIASPVGVVYYENYSELDFLLNQLNMQKSKIQCMVSINREIPGTIDPGRTQYPDPWDYADGIDTIRFLMDLSA